MVKVSAICLRGVSYAGVIDGERGPYVFVLLIPIQVLNFISPGAACAMSNLRRLLHDCYVLS